jgi:hypothetical protein
MRGCECKPDRGAVIKKMSVTSRTKAVRNRKPLPLGKIVKCKELLKRRKGVKLFSQGEEADAIYFIHPDRQDPAHCCLAAGQEGGTRDDGSS